MPPNGWGCRCRVRALNKAQAEREGISASPKLRDVEHINTRTGEIERHPEGVDPSFAHNPGDRLGALVKIAENKHGEGFADALMDELAGGLEVPCNSLHYGLLHEPGAPEIPAQHAGKPTEILLVKGTIQAHLLPQSLHILCRGVHPEDRGGRVARSQMHESEDEDRDDKEHGDQSEQSFEGVTQHVVLNASVGVKESRSPACPSRKRLRRMARKLREGFRPEATP